MMKDIQKFDKRLIDRKLKNGEITQKEYKKFLDSLEECKNYTEIEEEELLKTAGIKKRND